MASMREDRGESDLTRRIEELENSLSIALDINDKLQRENKKVSDRVRAAEGETSIIKGIGMNSPEMRAVQKSIKEVEAAAYQESLNPKVISYTGVLKFSHASEKD